MKLKAHGKVLLYGGYSILETFDGKGGIGLVLNVNKGTFADITKLDYNNCIIEVPRKEISVSGKIENNDLIIEDHKYLKFVIDAIRTTIKHLKKEGGFSISLENDKELGYYKMKTGIGSSATSTVVTVASVLFANGINPIENKELVFNLANQSHRNVQEKIGSGFDISCAVYGSQFYRIPIKGETTHTKITSRQHMFPDYFKILIAFSGKSAFTVNLVKNVRKYKEEKESEYTEFMKGYNLVNEELSEKILKLPKIYDEKKVEEFVSLLEKSWELRKKLGVLSNTPIETDGQTNVLQEIKKNGALCAGFSGAGGGDSIVVICKDDESRNQMIEYLEKNNFNVFKNLKVGNYPLEIVE
ncbi:hypothetical protein HOD20_04830 [archaeon]|jgi:mevalonate kinase|nr:hypothetical protein [archaeon]MBT4646722.1 hypothetical protein [archaeon]MBT6821083.1 hypothetical protein [archaeon]MBT7392076.1 hypothetical protein [archaeon]